VREDVLRYHKTLLLWNKQVQVQAQETPDKKRKLDQVKRTILEILKEHEEGVSLAQLPLYL
jgi:hypothetical protein